MIEITSPGKLLSSIDFDELEARQSDIRNKVIANIGFDVVEYCSVMVEKGII
ncbi:ATP-binding protein [Sphingobacterium spiritivorum]|uniref:ATP-binding protein n=1 Tax=Sphingobacterium spiritivorum TaxID=258 RepID=UPI00191854EB|nr:hypothetical protein I6J02_07290 [Sphingobacterium spiritivorum]